MHTLFASLFAILLCGSSTHSVKSEIYLIPEGFEGRVNVIFRKRTKITARYENAKRVYIIPSDGILVSDYEFQEGMINREFFILDSRGQRAPLLVFDGKNPVNDELRIFNNGTLGVYGNSDSNLKRYYHEFLVTSKNKIDKYFSMDSIAEFEAKVKRKIRVKF